MILNEEKKKLVISVCTETTRKNDKKAKLLSWQQHNRYHFVPPLITPKIFLEKSFESVFDRFKKAT